MSNKKFSGSINGKGYYIALILCAAAIGISGYLYYRNASEEPEQLEQPSQSVAATQPQDGVLAVATDPTLQPQSQSQTQSPPVSQEPVKQTEAPAMKTAAPVSGETVAEYAKIGRAHV